MYKAGRLRSYAAREKKEKEIYPPRGKVENIYINKNPEKKKMPSTGRDIDDDMKDVGVRIESERHHLLPPSERSTDVDRPAAVLPLERSSYVLRNVHRSYSCCVPPSLSPSPRDSVSNYAREGGGKKGRRGLQGGYGLDNASNGGGGSSSSTRP